MTDEMRIRTERTAEMPDWMTDWPALLAEPAPPHDVRQDMACRYLLRLWLYRRCNEISLADISPDDATRLDGMTDMLRAAGVVYGGDGPDAPTGAAWLEWAAYCAAKWPGVRDRVDKSGLDLYVDRLLERYAAC